MRSLFLLFLSILFFSCGNKQNTENAAVLSDEIQNEFAIVLHGGAGTILRENMSDSMQNAYTQKLKEAISTGHQILADGGNALDAVAATINILEDSPLFNAGKGAVFTHEGRNELDASIMEGKNLNAGAVAGVRRIKNPINLARDVMEKSPHVMLYGNGAEEFARENGYEMTDTSYFYTQINYDRLQQVIHQNKMGYSEKSENNAYKYGTVGCVALDKHGTIAAGTSTGGMTNKRWNRIGDSPIIGAGTYANNNTCGISATGWGEKFIRSVVAYDISALMKYKGLSLKEATDEVIHNKLPKMEGDGGIIGIDKNGNIVMEFNTPGMYRAAMNDKGELTVGLFENEE